MIGKPPKKTGKKVHNSCELWGGSANFGVLTSKKCFFRANFPKNMLKLIHNVPFVCLYKIQSLNSFKIPDAGFFLVLPYLFQNNIK